MLRALLLLPALPLLLSACGGDCDCEDSEPVVPEDTAPDVHDTAPPDTQDGPRTDLDGDGWAWPEDCNDQDASVGPDALDVINGADDNCDGVVDVHTLAAAHSKMLGEASGDWAGANVAGVGDVNADGYADIGISAWYSDASANNAGSLYVVLGPVAPGEWSLAYADVRLSGESAGDNLSRRGRPRRRWLRRRGVLRAGRRHHRPGRRRGLPHARTPRGALGRGLRPRQDPRGVRW